MKLMRLISDILVGHNSVFNNDQIHLINTDIQRRSKYVPVCKKTITYIVGIVLINDRDEVCLIQEAKESCKYKWYLPAGRVESNENLVEAAIRETKEEAGYVVEPLCMFNVEIDRASLWYRFTFLARITGGCLKEKKDADSESLQASWFKIASLADKSFQSELRACDIIDQIRLAQRYYAKFRIDSMSSLSDADFVKLKDSQNLILPAHNSHEHVTFSFVVIDESASHCILYELDENSSVLPSVLMMPDVYLIPRSTHSLLYAIDYILLPACFKNTKDLRHSDEKFVLTIDYNGKKEKPQAKSRDGLHIIFLVTLIQPPSGASSSIALRETNPPYKWEKIELVDEIKEKLNQPFHFITLRLL